MKKINKIRLLTTMLGAAALTAGIAALNVSSVETKAATTASTFAMESGASVRAVAGESGIRWTTNVTEAWFTNPENIPANADDVSFGTFVTAASNVDSVTDIDKDTAEVSDIVCGESASFSGGTFTYYSAITYKNVTESQNQAYATELVARSYVKYTTDGGETYTYKYADATDTQRCMRAVALEAYKDGDHADIVTSYFGTEQTSENFGGFYETAVPDTVATDYTVAYAGAKKVGTLSGGSLTLDGLELGDKASLNLFTDAGDYAFTDEFQYVDQALTNANFATVLNPSEATTLSGYYALAEDIALTGTWTSSQIFNGTLDGNGRKITGLAPNYGSATSSRKKGGGLFWVIASATFKNLSMEGVSLTNKQMGAFAYGLANGISRFENVYVSFLPGLFNYDRVGGLVAQQRSSTSIGDAVVTDCVIYMPEHAGTSGFVVGHETYNGNVTIQNSTFIGGNGAVQGGADPQATVTQENTVITDAVAAHKAINAKEAKDVTFAETAYRADHPYVELDDKLTGYDTLTGDEIVVLTKDVGNYSAVKSLIKDTVKPNFTGVFDGQGYKFNAVGAASNYGKGYLFNQLSGSVKNLFIYNATMGSSSSTKQAFIAATIPENATAYIENVLVQGKRLTATTVASPICHTVNGAIVMKDVVAYVMSGATIGSAAISFVGTLAETATVTAQNCYFIDEMGEAPLASGTVDESVFSDVKRYTAVEQFQAEYANSEKLLPEMMIGWFLDSYGIELKKSQA